MQKVDEIVELEHEVIRILASRYTALQLYQIWSDFIENIRQVATVNMDKKQTILNVYDAIA